MQIGQLQEQFFELDITVPDKLYGRLHILDRISQSPD